MPTRILPDFAISTLNAPASPAVAACRGDLVVPPVRQGRVLAWAEGGRRPGMLRIGVGHQQALRCDLDRRDPVVEGTEMGQGAVALDGQRLAAEVLVVEHLARGRAG